MHGLEEMMLQLSVLFEYPYWIGLIEDGQLFAVQHIFGAEPSGEEVYAFVQCDFVALLKQTTSWRRGPSRGKRTRPNIAVTEHAQGSSTS
ncbi:MAG: YjdF family protein [Anaerolineae bacterium]|nr:YjdF family protein [Anaerolineae bacterium]